MRGNSSHGVMTMTVETPKWTRSLRIEGWNQGRKKAFIVIHAPPKERGNTTLRRGGKMWMWLARVERLLKVPPTMMHSSWQGSDFTYEDIVKADSIVRDYTHRILKTTKKNGVTTHVIEAVPKEDAPVVWGKILFTASVYPDGWVLPVKEEDYNERGDLIRIITLSDVRTVDGKLVPMRMECVPLRKKGRKTVIQYEKITFNLQLPDSFFSLSRLQK